MSLRAEHLGFAYRPGTPVLEDVSMTCAPGEIVGLFGPNGSGKSTLLRCLNGALQPQAGAVWLDDDTIQNMSPREVATRIAVVPQDTPIDVPFTASQVVELGRYAYRPLWVRGQDEDHAIVSRCLRRLGVLDLAGRPFARLSGGERQRVAVARALAQLGAYLLLDEPSTHLDITHQLDLYRLLREVASEGVGVLMIGHDLFMAPLFVDRAILLHAGRVFSAGPPEAVLTPEHLGHVYGCRLSVTWPSKRQFAVSLPSELRLLPPGLNAQSLTRFWDS